MNGTGGEEDVNARLGRVFDGFGGPIDVGDVAAGQAANGRPLDLPGDGLHRLEITGGRDGEARFDDVHSQVFERVRDLELLGQVHAGAGGLFAVTQRRVEDHQAVVG